MPYFFKNIMNNVTKNERIIKTKFPLPTKNTCVYCIEAQFKESNMGEK